MENIKKDVEFNGTNYQITVSNDKSKVYSMIGVETFDFLIGTMKSGIVLTQILLSEIRCRNLKGKGFINNKFYELSDNDKQYILFGNNLDEFNEDEKSVYDTVIDLVLYGMSVVKSVVVRGEIINYVLTVSIDNGRVQYNYATVKAGSFKDLNFC
jgi:hypothetical protein